MKLSVVMTLLLILVASAHAGAQTLVSEQVFISLNALYQVTSNDFDDTTTIRVNAENGRLDTDYDVGGGLAEMDGAPEVTAQRVAEEHAVLHGQRSIDTELARDARVLAPRRVGRQQQRDRIAREPHDHEHDGGDQPHGDESPCEAGGEEADDRAHR